MCTRQRTYIIQIATTDLATPDTNGDYI